MLEYVLLFSANSLATYESFCKLFGQLIMASMRGLGNCADSTELGGILQRSRELISPSVLRVHSGNPLTFLELIRATGAEGCAGNSGIQGKMAAVV